MAELSMHSAEFRDWWTRQDVKGPSSGRKTYRHPEVGVLTLDYIGMLLPGTPDHQLVTYTAPEGSSSQAAMDRLAARVWAGADGGGGNPHPPRRGRVTGDAGG